jgi:hypothetical protein
MVDLLGYVACMAKARNVFRIFGCNFLGRNHLYDLGVDGVLHRNGLENSLRM